MRLATLPFGVRVLYISYDGVLEPAGESQVVAYVERLAGEHSITLLSFERRKDLADRSRVAQMTQRFEARKINWVRLRYHRRPRRLSTMFDILRGMLKARKAARKYDVQVIHARGYIAAMIARAARKASSAGFLYDMREFWVDGKVEAGRWKAGGYLYRLAKWWERRLFRSANGIVSLTAEGVRAFAQVGVAPRHSARVEIIPACADLNRFTPDEKDPELLSSLGLTDSVIIGCSGAMSGWYMRDETLKYLAHLALAFEQVRILIVTREDQAQLRRDAEAAGMLADRLVITTAAFSDMPRFTRLFDAGVFFIRPTLSKRASAPTKLAEFLACGVPVIVNEGVGDSGAVVMENAVGVVLPALDPDTFDRALPAVRAALSDPDMPGRCRALAEERFDLDQGVERYGQLYRLLVGTGMRASRK